MESRGEWVAFLDDDDVWSPDKLAAQVQATTATGRDWAYVGAVHIDEHNHVIGGVPRPAGRPCPAVARLQPGAWAAAQRHCPSYGVGSCRAVRRATPQYRGLGYVAAFGDTGAASLCPAAAARVPGSYAQCVTEYRGDSGWSRAYRARAWCCRRLWHAVQVVRRERAAPTQTRHALRYFALAARHGQAQPVVADLLGRARRRGAALFGQRHPIPG